MSLRDSKSERENTGLFFAEGVRLCEDAAKSGEIVACFFTDAAAKKEPERLGRIISASENCREVSDKVSAKLGDTKNSQGVFCLCKKLDNGNIADKINNNGKYMVMSGLRDPGNVGTILRSCDAFGVDGLIMTRDCADIYSPKAVRATMGGIFRVPVFTVRDEEELFSLLRGGGIKSYAAALTDKSVPLSEVKFGKGSAVIIGNEAHGLSEYALSQSDVTVKIEMHGEAESLNAAAAAAILAYSLTK